MDVHTAFEGISLTKTPGQHGSDETYADSAMAARLGGVSGVVFRHEGEKTLYLAGDTVWNRFVEETIGKYAPDVIVVNAGWAQIEGCGGIIMGEEDISNVHRTASEALIVATHMEAINHCVLTRGQLRAFAEKHGFSEKLLIPLDGETCAL